MQISGVLLQDPTTKLMMGAELPQRPRLNFVTSTLAKGVMAFIQRRTNGLEWSMGSSEKPAFCSFPLSTGVDALIEGGELGSEFVEDAAVKARRKGGETTVDLKANGKTYSLAFFSSYIDFAKWRIANMPVGSPPLKPMVGDGPVDVVVYDQDPADATRKRYWMRCRVCAVVALAGTPRRGGLVTFCRC